MTIWNIGILNFKAVENKSMTNCRQIIEWHYEECKLIFPKSSNLWHLLHVKLLLWTLDFRNRTQ